MSSRELRKMFVDSRFRASGTESDFSITFPDVEEFPSNWSCWVNSVSFPHSWFNVNGNNNKFYLLEFDPAAPGVYYRRGFTLAADNYTLATLATALQSGLNAASNVGAYTVALTGAEGLTLSSTTEFRIPSRSELTNAQWKSSVWDAASYVLGELSDYSPAGPQTANDLLSPPLSNTAWLSSFSSGIVDLSSNHSLYLHSSLTNWCTVDPIGRRSIMARIPVDVAYGYTVQHRHTGLAQDAVDVSNLRLKNADFSLRNVYGEVMDLRGSHVVIELVFGPSAA